MLCNNNNWRLNNGHELACMHCMLVLEHHWFAKKKRRGRTSIGFRTSDLIGICESCLFQSLRFWAQDDDRVVSFRSHIRFALTNAHYLVVSIEIWYWAWPRGMHVVSDSHKQSILHNHLYRSCSYYRIQTINFLAICFFVTACNSVPLDGEW